MRTLSVLVAALVFSSGVGLAQARGIEPVEGGWKGETSQGLPVYFGVREGRVINTRYHFHWGFCGVFGSHAKRADLEVDPTGRWSIKDTRGSLIKGAFVAPNLVEGTVLVEGRELPGCPTVAASFVASP